MWFVFLLTPPYSEQYKIGQKENLEYAKKMFIDGYKSFYKKKAKPELLVEESPIPYKEGGSMIQYTIDNIVKGYIVNFKTPPEEINKEAKKISRLKKVAQK